MSRKYILRAALGVVLGLSLVCAAYAQAVPDMNHYVGNVETAMTDVMTSSSARAVGILAFVIGALSIAFGNNSLGLASGFAGISLLIMPMFATLLIENTPAGGAATSAAAKGAEGSSVASVVLTIGLVLALIVVALVFAASRETTEQPETAAPVPDVPALDALASEGNAITQERTVHAEPVPPAEPADSDAPRGHRKIAL